MHLTGYKKIIKQRRVVHHHHEYRCLYHLLNKPYQQTMVLHRKNKGNDFKVIMKIMQRDYTFMIHHIFHTKDISLCVKLIEDQRGSI